MKKIIDGKIIELSTGGQDTKYTVALNARHRQAVTEAIGNVEEAIGELKAGNDEVTAMMLRTAYQAMSNIEQRNIDEQILENIFNRFCVGK